MIRLEEKTKAEIIAKFSKKDGDTFVFNPSNQDRPPVVFVAYKNHISFDDLRWLADLVGTTRIALQSDNVPSIGIYIGVDSPPPPVGPGEVF